MEKGITKGIAIFYGPKVKGYVKFYQKKGKKTLVHIKLSGLGKNKERAIHCHEYGDERAGCKSLGGHWNPTRKKHGSFVNGSNHHHGDMVNNIVSNSKGEVDLKYYDPLLKLTGKNHIFGRSVVIHTGVDDLGLGGNKESLITGNAGSRIGCGIIVRYKN